MRPRGYDPTPGVPRAHPAERDHEEHRVAEDDHRHEPEVHHDAHDQAGGSAKQGPQQSEHDEDAIAAEGRHLQPGDQHRRVQLGCAPERLAESPLHSRLHVQRHDEEGASLRQPTAEEDVDEPHSHAARGLRPPEGRRVPQCDLVPSHGPTQALLPQRAQARWQELPRTTLRQKLEAKAVLHDSPRKAIDILRQRLFVKAQGLQRARSPNTVRATEEACAR
mmetsp:Transcript_57323/g.166380  ORF Transcript_57323/g.166380 Transcript_57323/m.166380 type:complete len:221 (+) Transcript_57323:573-1235(+)